MAPPPKITAQMKRDALLGNPFFAPLQAKELDEIVAASIQRRVQRGATIFEKGDAGRSMMAVMAGRVRIGASSQGGKEVMHRLIGPGQIFGEIALLDGKPRTAAAIADEDTTLMVVERRVFLPMLMRHQGMVERLLEVLCERLRRTTIALEELALCDLTERLARVLARLAQEYGRPAPDGGVFIEQRLSHSDLASLVSSSRESVTKQIGVWQRGGLLTKTGREIVIHDLAALRRTFE